MESFEDLPMPPLVQPAQDTLQPMKLKAKGMWRTWVRVFQNPANACLDLLDNCLDATLDSSPDRGTPFQARVELECLKLEVDGESITKTGLNGITIMNNSYRPILGLEEVLTLFNHKETDTVTIGENGVGLKQGCAALSDTSFVLTRNHGIASFGIISKALQTHDKPYLPSYSFQVDMDNNPHNQGEKLEALENHIRGEAGVHPELAEVIASSLGGSDEAATTRSFTTGVKNLAFQFLRMWLGEWENEEYVFQVVLCNLNRSKTGGEAAVGGLNNNPARAILDSLKKTLPHIYINVPSSLHGFNFLIDGAPVCFSYWENRLVELSKFTVHIPSDTHIREIKGNGWTKVGYKLNIYCGFDPIQLRDNNKKKMKKSVRTTCSLHVYSRRRLIKHESDARGLLGLSDSGAYNRQGLTILVDDDGNLPLTPTKQDMAWNEQNQGDVHRVNFYAWVGAVAHFFWEYHFGRIRKLGSATSPRSTGIYNRAVESFAVHAESRRVQSELSETLKDSHFTQYRGMKWRKQGEGDAFFIRRIGGTNIRPPKSIQGTATVFRLTDEWIRGCYDEQIAAQVLKGRKKLARPRQEGRTDAALPIAPVKKKTILPKRKRKRAKRQGKEAWEEDEPEVTEDGDSERKSTRPRRRGRKDPVSYKEPWDENGHLYQSEETTEAEQPDCPEEPAAVVSSSASLPTKVKEEPDCIDLTTSSDEEPEVVVRNQPAGVAPGEVVKFMNSFSDAMSAFTTAFQQQTQQMKKKDAEVLRLRRALNEQRSRGISTTQRPAPRHAAARAHGRPKNDEDYATDSEGE